MIKIAVCDDVHEELSEVEACLKEFAAGRNDDRKLLIKPYDSSLNLEKDVREGRLYDIYILDILMPRIDGLKLGEAIRKKQPEAVIIYLSSSDDFFSQAFDVYAFQYQLKPLKKDKFFEIMERAVSSFMGPEKRWFFLSSKRGSVRVPFDHIVYAELSSRTLILHLEDGNTLQSGYLRQSFETLMAPVLKDCRFVQPHKSFIINLDYVQRLDPAFFEMSDGSRIPISRKRSAETKKTYMDFIFRAGSPSDK